MLVIVTVAPKTAHCGGRRGSVIWLRYRTWLRIYEPALRLVTAVNAVTELPFRQTTIYITVMRTVAGSAITRS